MTAFSEIANDVAPHLIGCPSRVIETSALKVAADLCQRAKVWRMDSTPITMVSGTNTYSIVLSDLTAEICDVDSVHLQTSSGNYTELAFIERGAFRNAFYPLSVTGEGYPVYYTQFTSTTITVNPVPDTTDTLLVSVFARPVLTAASFPDALYSEFRRVLFHGILHDLMMLPKQNWSNERLAAYHGKQWTYLLAEAKYRSGNDYHEPSQPIKFTPFA